MKTRHLPYKNKLVLFCIGLILLSGIPMTINSQSLDSTLNVANETSGDTAYIKYLHDEIWSLRHKNRPLAFELLDHLEEWYDSHDVDYRRDANIYYYGLLHKYDGDYDHSAGKFKNYLDYQIQKKDSNRIGAVYNALSNLYFDQSVLDTAMYYTTLALDIYEKIRDTSTYVNMLTRKGILLMEVDRFEEALQHQEEAMQLGLGVASPNIYSNVLNNTALVYEAMNVVDSTIYYYKQYIDYALTHDLKRAVYYGEYNLATALIKQKKYEESLSLLQSAYARANKLDDPNMLNFIAIGLAELYNNMGQPRKALNQIALMDTSMNTVEHQKERYYQAYVAHKKLGNNSIALQQHEHYAAFADSMLNESVSQQVQELEAKYETEKKEQKIQNLQVIQEANEKQLWYQRGIIGLSILGIGILGFFFYQLKKKNQLIAENNKTIKKNLEQKNLLLQEIHHRVKNNLQVISSLLRLQTRSSSGNAANALASSESRVRSMALIHQHLYQGEDITSVHMATYLKDLAQQVVQSHMIQDKVELVVDISEEISLDVKSVVPIGLITNEWLTNACKYAFSETDRGQILLSFQKIDEDQYVLEVKDNGIGLNTAPEQQSGFGTRLVTAFAHRINGKVSMTNNGGTVCRLQLSIPKDTE
ncbi:MAG: histidine kinase dimerization/phosphoacceptor domain -containing protein [Saprospiraceae bacterium]|nr:histidine kinase dimerization/phosphoacceptor domain -containing protein [Saprospiraceae bacterium]